MTFLWRTASVLFAALAMLAFLLAIALLALGRLEGVLFYLAVAVVASAAVGAIMRRDVRRRRAAEVALPPEQRPVRRVPRSPITFPLRETSVTFALWYVAAAIIDRAVTGEWSSFTLAAIAPFAAFILTALTIAGRHMAFRLTAEEAAADTGLAEREERGV